MKLKNILIAGALAFGMAFTFSGGSAFAKDLISFEEFVQDKAQFEKWEKAHVAHIKKVQELKDEKRVKRLEYKAFAQNPNVEPKMISKVARDIVMLDRQIKTENENFIKITREEYGVDFGPMRFHKDLTPCFKKHFNQFGEPMDFGPCPAMRPFHHFEGNVLPHMRGHIPPHLRGDIPPHMRGDMPPHMMRGDMPPYFEGEKPAPRRGEKMPPKHEGPRDMAPEVDM